ncbi:AAA family ATPase [Methylosinus sp. Sm6]|uniref:AAA family ATPase n=1 Tax=Methylosinus sp. Sm6 TaxID=2866948 RepID=UPI001C99BCFA|nr:AAA family ATPase [Methylosinus sp. Sm6]MBY6241384.1 AAA family ATPase [Methylosinus sp. Sm6]
MLVVFSGRPGSGKTTIARLLARRLEAVYLRIDTLDATIHAAFGGDTEDLSYRIAYGVAADNLALGRRVVADCVNDVNVTRDAWRDVALRTAARVAEVEIVCSDAQEHRRRVDERIADIAGLVLPSWEKIAAQRPDPWLRDPIVIDTAGRSAEDCLLELMARLPCDKR